MEIMDNMEKNEIAFDHYQKEMQNDINNIFLKWQSENIPYCESLAHEYMQSCPVMVGEQSIKNLFINGQTLFGKELLEGIYHENLQFGSSLLQEDRLDLLLQAQRDRINALDITLTRNTETKAFEHYIEYIFVTLIHYLDKINSQNPDYIQKRDAMKFTIKNFVSKKAKEREGYLCEELQTPLLESFYKCYENLLLPALAFEAGEILKEDLNTKQDAIMPKEDIQALKPIL